MIVSSLLLIFGWVELQGKVLVNQPITKGQMAPNLILNDQDGKVVELSSYKGKKIVLYFYPMDSTPGCTTQAKALSENIELLESQNIKVIGISNDSVNSHKNFSKKYNLKFTLLSDKDGIAAEKYAVEKSWKMYERVTFLINENFQIEKVFPKVKYKQHLQDILDFYNIKLPPQTAEGCSL